MQPNENFLQSKDDATYKNIDSNIPTAIKVDEDKYAEYNALNLYQKTCLPANNYWRILYGQKPIDVPPTKKHYKTYFNPACYDLSKAYLKQQAIVVKEIEFRNRLEPISINIEPIESPQKVAIVEKKEPVKPKPIETKTIILTPTEKPIAASQVAKKSKKNTKQKPPDNAPTLF